MEIKISGIQCDNPSCDYEELDNDWGNTAEEVLATSESYLNQPCPKCGESLLTPADHEAVKMLFSLKNLATQTEELLYDGQPVPEEDKVKVNLSMNGSGQINPIIIK